MIKQDIVHHVIERTGLPRTKAEAAVDTVFEGLKEALAAGERIELRGFGVFSVRARKTGIGRNPRTGTEVSITPGKASASSLARNCTHSPKGQRRKVDPALEIPRPPGITIVTSVFARPRQPRRTGVGLLLCQRSRAQRARPSSKSFLKRPSESDESDTRS